MKFWLAPLPWRSARPDRAGGSQPVDVGAVGPPLVGAPDTVVSGVAALTAAGAEVTPGDQLALVAWMAPLLMAGGYVCGTTPDRALSLGTGALVFGVEGCARVALLAPPFRRRAHSNANLLTQRAWPPGRAVGVILRSRGCRRSLSTSATPRAAGRGTKEPPCKWRAAGAIEGGRSRWTPALGSHRPMAR
jgi:hypothetical protein